jgi:hypothetical protein
MLVLTYALIVRTLLALRVHVLQATLIRMGRQASIPLKCQLKSWAFKVTKGSPLSQVTPKTTIHHCSLQQPPSHQVQLTPMKVRQVESLQRWAGTMPLHKVD